MESQWVSLRVSGILERGLQETGWGGEALGARGVPLRVLGMTGSQDTEWGERGFGGPGGVFEGLGNFGERMARQKVGGDEDLGLQGVWERGLRETGLRGVPRIRGASGESRESRVGGTPRNFARPRGGGGPGPRERLTLAARDE